MKTFLYPKKLLERVMGKKEEKEKSYAWIAILAMVVVGVFFFVLLVGVLLAGISSTPSTTRGNVAVIEIDNIITTDRMSQGLFATTMSSRDVVNRIVEAEENPRVHAIMFEINSPGGTPVATHEIVKAVKGIEKPTVAVIRETGASGAYWIASATDYIFADELSMTGSVGVLASYLEFSGFLERYNVTYQEVTGGEYKEIGSPFKELAEDEELLLQEKVDLVHNFFADDVINNRGLEGENADLVRTGIFFMGLEAREIGLIDDFGGEVEAKAYLEELLGMDVSLARKERRTGFLEAMLMNTNFGFSFQDLLGRQNILLR